MPHFSFHRSTDPNREVEKRIASDARVDQKNLDNALGDLKKAESTHTHAVKSADRAQHSLDKAVNQEYKAANELNKVQHQHDVAVGNQENAEKTLELKRQHQARLEQDLQQRRATMEDFQHRNDVNDQSRETKLSEIHAQAASRAGSRADSADHEPYPVGRGATGTAEPTPSQQQNVNVSDAPGVNRIASIDSAASVRSAAGVDGAAGPAAGPTTGVPSA